MMGKAARRGTSQLLQQRSPSGRWLNLMDSPSSASASSGGLGSPCGSAAGQITGELALDEWDLGLLRSENKLLRRQLENHPELHRLAVENRLLREHLASVVQQHALAREEPPWPRGHKHARQANSGDPGVVAAKAAEKLSRREEKGKPLSAALPPGPFPGIEDATQISASSSSAESGSDREDHALTSSPPRGGADASSFLPTMAREVEDLLRVKEGLEDSLRQAVEERPAATKGQVQVAAGTEVEPRVAADILRGSSDALRFVEGMLAKGKGEALLLGSANGDQIGGSIGGSSRKEEGLDERDVFLSLMRSLPSEGPTMSRHGVGASSAPHLSPGSRLGLSSGLAPSRLSGGGMAATIATLRPSNSTGSTARTGMMRNQSMMRLHRISEQAPSSGGGDAESSRPSRPETPPVEAVSVPLPSQNSGDMLRDATQKFQNLHHHLEHVSDAYRDIREQIRPLQEEYSRRLDECRFLESQCKRLDVHCRLLEERTIAIEGGSQLPSPQAGALASAGSGATLRLPLTNEFPLTASAPSSLLRNLPSLATPTHDSMERPRLSPTASPVASPTGSPAAAGGHRVWGWTGAAASAAGSAAASAGSPSAAGVAMPVARRVNSQASLGTGAPGSSSPSGAPGSMEVPPRGLLYAASVSELGERRVQPARPAGHSQGQMSDKRAQEYIRRVASAPQLPVAQAAAQFRMVETAHVETSSQAPVGADDRGASEHSPYAAASPSSASAPGKQAPKVTGRQYAAMGTIGESQESRAPSKSPASSPGRSSSVGSGGRPAAGMSRAGVYGFASSPSSARAGSPQHAPLGSVYGRGSPGSGVALSQRSRPGMLAPQRQQSSGGHG